MINVDKLIFKIMIVNSMNKYILVLTGCVSPCGMQYTKLQDSKLREMQYLNSLDFYLNKTNFMIVFIENTMYNLPSRYNKYVLSGRLKYVTFDGNIFNKSRGKGYGEALILEKLVNLFELTNDENVYFIKVTGRLIIKNICDLIPSFRLNRDFFMANIIKETESVQTEICIFTMQFLKKYFLPLKELINDEKTISFEHVMYKAVMKSITCDNILILPFKFPIWIMGQSGSTGKYYSKPSWKQYIRAYIKYYVCFLNK